MRLKKTLFNGIFIGWYFGLDTWAWNVFVFCVVLQKFSIFLKFKPFSGSVCLVVPVFVTVVVHLTVPNYENSKMYKPLQVQTFSCLLAAEARICRGMCDIAIFTIYCVKPRFFSFSTSNRDFSKFKDSNKMVLFPPFFEIQWVIYFILCN